MEDKELKKKLKKIPDVDKNGDPIYKIATEIGKKHESPKKEKEKKSDGDNG